MYCSTNGRCIAGFPLLKALESGRHSDANARCIAVQIGSNALQYFFEKLYGLGAPKHCPMFRIIFPPQPPSLLILLLEPGSERKVLTKET